jgi:hypothetical protein
VYLRSPSLVALDVIEIAADEREAMRAEREEAQAAARNRTGGPDGLHQ